MPQQRCHFIIIIIIVKQIHKVTTSMYTFMPHPVLVVINFWRVVSFSRH